MILYLFSASETAQRTEEQKAARKIQHFYHKRAHPLPKGMEIQDIDTKGLPIIDFIERLIREGKIPAMSLEDLYVKDITASTVGTSKEQIILIGYQKSEAAATATAEETNAPRIVYVLKKINVNVGKGENELQNITDAYLYWQKENKEDAVIKTKNGYTLKLSWHERLFHNTSDDTYYELLHAAQGRLLADSEKELVKKAKFQGLLNLDTFQKASDAEYEQYQRISEKTFKNWDEFLKTAYGDEKKPDDVMKPSDLHSVPMETIQALTKLIQERQEKLGKFDQFIKDLYWLKKYKVSEYEVVAFDKEGNLVLNKLFEENTQIFEVYEAFGSVLGAFFKLYNLPVDHKGLDPHHNNIFYDAAKKTITWIDLQVLGELLRGQIKEYRGETLDYALGVTHNPWREVVSGFWQGKKFFFPNITSEQKEIIVQQEKSLQQNLEKLYESFIEGFIQNYVPAEDDLKRAEVRVHLRRYLDDVLR